MAQMAAAQGTAAEKRASSRCSERPWRNALASASVSQQAAKAVASDAVTCGPS